MKRGAKVAWVVGVVLTIGCAAWYVWPISDEDGDGDALTLSMTGDALTDGAASTTGLVEPPFDLEAYAAVNLWNPRPPPPPEVTKTDDEPRRREIPLRLKLVAILNTPGSAAGSSGPRIPGSPEAAIYDPETDSVLIVGEGDRVNEHFSVKQIKTTRVELFDGHDVRVLELEDEPK